MMIVTKSLEVTWLGQCTKTLEGCTGGKGQEDGSAVRACFRLGSNMVEQCNRLPLKCVKI